MTPIQSAIQQVLAEHGLKESARDSKIFRAWREAVGEELARHARPVRYDARSKRMELTVEVASSAHLSELKSFTGEEFRKRTNEHLGRDAILKIVFRMKK